MFPLLTSPGPDLTRIAVSLQSSNRRVRPRLVWRNGTLLAFPVVHGVTGHFSSCVWYLRVSADDTRGCPRKGNSFSVGSRVSLWDGMMQQNKAIVPSLLCSYSVVLFWVFFFGAGGLVLFIALLHC